MSLNRFDRLGPQKDYSWETYIPKLPEINYDLLSQTMAQQQGQVDLANAISEKQPQVLQTEQDVAWYNQYKQKVDQGLTNVSKAYAEKGASEGNRAYRNYINDIKKAWRPGGDADILNNRYTGYYAAKKAIEDQYKDEVSPVNKTLALNQLQSQLALPINPNNGQYQQIVAPQLYKNPNLRGAINDMIKQIDNDGDTQFLGDTNKDWWITKIKSEGRPEEKIRLAYEALSQQPEFASQLGRDAEYQALQTDPDKYKAKFDRQIDRQLESIQTQLDGKNAKELLEQQGYDVSDLKKAKQEFLDQQKQLAQAKKDNFDLKTELTKDISKDYQDYAAGFSSLRVNKDLVFNKAKQAQLVNARSREKNQALFAIADSFIQEKAPTATVTTGVAQQLPEINQQYDNLTKERDSYKADIDKSLNSPNSVFNGWKLQDVAYAHNLWEQVNKNLPANASEEQKKAAFSTELSKGTYQWTPDQLSKVYQQMSSLDGGIKPAIQAYQEKQKEVERLDNARTYVATQYIDTPEGKQAFNLLKEFRNPNETDAQLIQRSLNNPEQFDIKSASKFSDVPMSGGYIPQGLRKTNAAQMFKSNMESDVKKNKAGINYQWGDMATYQVGFNKDDKSFKPVGDAIGSAFTSGTPYQWSSEGSMGLKFRGTDGEIIKNPGKVDMGDFVVAKNSKGLPVLNYSATVDGKSAKVSVDIIPGSPEAEQAIEGLKQAYIAKYNAGQTNSANAVINLMQSLQAPSLSDAGTQVQVESLTKAKAQQLNDVFIKDNSGKLVPASFKGWSGTDTKNSYEILDPKTGAILRYETYGIIDQQGNKFVADVFVKPDGTKVIKDTSNKMSTISQNRMGTNIRLNTPVEREATKLPNGQLINLLDE